MSANLEKLRENYRYSSPERQSRLDDFLRRFSKISNFPKAVKTPRKSWFLPLEELGTVLKRNGFPTQGALLIRQSRRWEFEDGFVHKEKNPQVA